MEKQVQGFVGVRRPEEMRSRRRVGLLLADRFRGGSGPRGPMGVKGVRVARAQLLEAGRLGRWIWVPDGRTEVSIEVTPRRMGRRAGTLVPTRKMRRVGAKGKAGKK